MVEKGCTMSKAEIMREAGYSEAIATVPAKITESKGFQELLEEAGLTQNLIAKSLADDIKAKPRKRVNELRLGADITGMIKRNNTIIPIQLNFGDDRDRYT